MMLEQLDIFIHTQTNESQPSIFTTPYIKIYIRKSKCKIRNDKLLEENRENLCDLRHRRFSDLRKDFVDITSKA